MCDVKIFAYATSISSKNLEYFSFVKRKVKEGVCPCVSMADRFSTIFLDSSKHAALLNFSLFLLYIFFYSVFFSLSISLLSREKDKEKTRIPPDPYQIVLLSRKVFYSNARGISIGEDKNVSMTCVLDIRIDEFQS